MGDIKRIRHNDEVYPFDFDNSITYTFPAGVALERFLSEIKENGKIMGTACRECGLIYVPASLFCERCFARLDEYVEMPTSGKVVTYAVNYEDQEGNKLSEPQIVAMVHLDGAHGGLIHFLRGIEAQDVKIGMPVDIVFIPQQERTGSILDISHFRPSAASQMGEIRRRVSDSE